MSTCHRFLRDRAGNVAVIFSLALLPVMLGIGTAVDYTRAAQARAALQTTADASALAAVVSNDASESAQRAAAMAFFPGGGQGPGDANLMASPTVSVGIASGVVTVTATGKIAASVLGVVGITEIPVHVTAVAARANVGPPVCVLSLNQTANDAVSFDGSTTFSSPACGVYSNSSSASAVSIGGSATVNAAGICAYGGVSDSVGVSPRPMTNCPRVEDPFKNLPVTTATGCTFNNVKVQPSETVTLSPGTYCGGIDFKGAATLSPGLYIIKNGALSINSQAVVTGSGVTFYLTGNGAGFDINAGGNIDISAMTTGDYRGMLLVQDRTSNVGAINTLSGNSNTKLNGTIYTPTQSIKVSGSGSFGAASDFMPLIADTVKFSGSTSVKVDLNSVPAGAALPKLPSGGLLKS